MRPRNEAARAQLFAALRSLAPARAADLAQRLGVSVPTLHRMLKESGDAVVSTGAGSRTRYAVRRPVRGVRAPLPLYRIDSRGRGEAAGELDLIEPQGSRLDLAPLGWPMDPAQGAWWEGLPYPLLDMRPQGFLGRGFARHNHLWLGVAPDPEAWSDDDVVHVLNLCGIDLPGDLVLGELAYEQWLRLKTGGMRILSSSDRPRAYAELAAQASSTGSLTSSAAGEFPKFTALREFAGAATPHVIVKFSGPDDSAAVRRWADLLVCEHLALVCISETLGIPAAATSILQGDGRTFIEVERFDRHGDFGRSGLCSLAAIDAALIGSGVPDWPRQSETLAQRGLLDAEAVEAVRVIWWYGRLIANTDMHTGNLSFRPGERLTLAPIYDMLPMFYAPLPGGEVPRREFEPALPLPAQRAAWQRACAAALCLWRTASGDTRISEGFRAICKANHERLEKVAELA